MRSIVAGVDGCRGGWVVALMRVDTGDVITKRIDDLESLFGGSDAPDKVAIDMPIGLPERSGPRGRAPERSVRPKLGKRKSSVFSVPSRCAVYAGVDASIPEADRYHHCCSVALKTSDPRKAVAKQSFHIFPKIVAIDAMLRRRRELIARVYECHPEVSFCFMNGEKALDEPKKKKNRPYHPGLDLRRGPLREHGFPDAAISPARAKELGVGEDDLIDACAAAWTAMRLGRGIAKSFPDTPEPDGCGLPMAIWA